MKTPRSHTNALFIVAGIVLGTCFSTGCVERRLTVRTDPPGARVYIDDYEIGTSPCSTHFTYYGTRKIRLVKDGFRTKTIYQPIPPPWYQIPPLDFVAENLVPGTIRDQRTLMYQLEPEVVVPGEELRRRAEAMRQAVIYEAGLHVVPIDRVAPPTGVNPNSPAKTVPSGDHIPSGWWSGDTSTGLGAPSPSPMPPAEVWPSPPSG